MSRTRKRSDETGTTDRGKHTFHRHEGELIRAWVRASLIKATRHLATCERRLAQRRTAANEEMHARAVIVLSWLQGLYHAGTQSIDALDWAEAWVYVTTQERYAGKDAKPKWETKTVPGME